MNILMGGHIAAGCVALAAGAAAVIARKGGLVHARSGTAFVAAMLLLWVSATVLHITENKPGSAIGDIFIGYFVLTSWVAARRHHGAAGRFEIFACAVALGLAALMVWGGLTGSASPTPVGRAPVFIIGGFCLLAGLLDLSVVLRRTLPPIQRISRHLWRMCSAFFLATGSFFLRQQQALPHQLRGSPILLVLAFAPFAVMAFWLVRVRLAGWRPIFMAAQARAQ
jgi:hypothetical protein